MKTITTDAVVEDLTGLLEDLKKRGFKVANVASDQRGTYVYLDDAEEQDPIPVVLEWVGRPAPKPQSKEWKRRFQAALPKKESIWVRLLRFFFRKRFEPPPPTVPEPIITEEPPPPEPPAPVDPKFFRKIL